MGAPIPVGVALATIVFTSSGDLEPMVSTFALEHDSVLPENWAQEIIDAFTDSGIFVAANFHSGWRVERVETDFNTTNGLIHNEVVVDVAGSAAADTVPTNCALLVHKRSALGGRKNRGRFYFPPFCLSEASVDRNGTISTTPLTTLRTRFTACFDQLTTTQGYSLVILHADATPATPVTSWLVDGKIATQRRRMR